MRAEQDFYVGKVRAIKNGIITLASKGASKKRIPFSAERPVSIENGDIVLLTEIDDVHVLWRSHSKDNVIIITNACNQMCRYCPQPRTADTFSNVAINRALLSNLEKKDISFVTITGGEPTLMHSALIDLLKQLLKKNPLASIALLTNGMEFDDMSFAYEIVKAGKSQTRICVSLHSDSPFIHDSITGVPGSFERTALGLLNLHRTGADIELRVVLNRLNFERLPDIAFSIGMNFPFVSHVAFMGLELHATAAYNAKEVWVDPPAYMNQLKRAIYQLQCRKIPSSIYNLPYCLVSKSLWAYMRDSISGWKKTFLPLCDFCLMKPTCPGLFMTSIFQSPSIRPIKTIL